MLDEGERTLLRRLAVFVGGCTLEEAEAVCHPDGDLPVEVIDGVSSLVDKSMLRQLPAQDQASDVRLYMLAMIREFALERLEEAGEGETLRQRHATYFADLATAGDAQWKGPNQRLWLDRLETEHSNLRAVLRWACDHDQTELGLRLAVAMRWFWYMRSHFTEGRGWLAELLAKPSNAPSVTRCKALTGAGFLAFHQGDNEEAQRLHSESLAAA